MKWETFKTIVNQINQILTNDTDISIFETVENTVEIYTGNNEYPFWRIGEGVCDGKKYASLTVEKRFYEDK